MRKCILWGMGELFRRYISIIKAHEEFGHFEVIGITSNDNIYTEIYGYKFIPKESLQYGAKKNRVFKCNFLEFFNLDMERYIGLKDNPPTIFSNNCWGGFTYHSLGLEFTSPLVNMYEDAVDYLKMCKDPQHYMNEPLKLVGTMYNSNTKKLSCNGVW